MAVNSIDGSSQMQQVRMQMRKMDGTGGGQGKGQGGMRDIMQSLSVEDRNSLREQMSSVDQSKRSDIISQMKQIDQSSMSSEDYFQSLLDIINNNTQTSVQASTAASALYA